MAAIRQTRNRGNRNGNIIVLASLMMVLMVGSLAFAIDIGYLAIAKTELQRTADAAALSASWDLITDREFGDDPYLTAAITDTRSRAVEYAASNHVTNAAPVVDGNTGNSIEGDVVIGYMSDFSDPDAALQLGDTSLFNAVNVRVHRSSSQNGTIPLSFARIFGWDERALEAEAMAALHTNFDGFQTPGDGSNLGILPFALDEETWLELVAGTTADDWTWDKASGEVKPWSDGIREVNLFPQGTGSPGNRGTIDIGSNNNSTNDIARHITDGVSPEDMEYHDGELVFDEYGELILNGDTGISAGVKDELASIIGEPRIIPIFREVNGPGNNAMYTIVKFVGIRILKVQLTGSATSKHVTIQPAPMVTLGGIPATGPTRTHLIYAPPRLVR